ncbi:MAG: N-acetylglucosamine kinase [Cyanobacteria bacterium K_DeepCast_35m_m2_155]|nr:N-acetylglucosamine kinase [Cyanobacteria bacterium K_DeepCast_35m_m2_155]
MGSLIAGFDAGQTHTRCRLALLLESGALQPLGQGEGPGVSHLDAAGGEQRFQQALQQSLAAALLQERTPAEPLQAAAVGASGIETGSMVQSRAQQLAAAALQLPADRLSVSGDERTALAGARGACSAGILLISGTGCIALGRNSTGHEHRCGGWGWLLDGAGSAMDIGRDGLALSLQMADGRQKESGLRAALWQALDLNPEAPAAPQAIKSLVVQPGFGAAGFARLAPVVHALAEAGDQQAQAIVARSAGALVDMATAIARELALEAPLVWTSGGAIEHLGLLRQGLDMGLQRSCPGAQLARPSGDGCDGALSLARALLRPR